MRLGLSAALVGAGLLMAVGSAASEPITFGSSAAGGASYGIGLALAKELSNEAGIDMRVAPMRSTTQIVPLVNSGEVQVAAANALELAEAMHGTGSFEGSPMTELRVIGNIYPYRITYAVPKDDPAQTILDLKGKRLPHGFRAASTGSTIMTAILVAAGMSYDDVTPVEVSDYANARDVFLSKRTDAYHFVLGSGANVAVDQKVGGLRALALPDDPEAAARLKAYQPGLRIDRVSAGAAMGVDRDMRVVAYDYMLYTSARTPDEIVEKIATAIVSGAGRMTEAAKGFEWFDPQRVAADNGIPFHPAALRVYSKFGLPVPNQ